MYPTFLCPVNMLFYRARFLQPSRNITSRRLISCTAVNMHKFIVYAPDKTDEGCFQRRLSVRPKHLENSAKLHEAGELSVCSVLSRLVQTTSLMIILEIGGAMLTPESITGSEKKMVGSVLILEANSLADVTKRITEDIYYTAGVVRVTSRSLYNSFSMTYLLAVGSGEASNCTVRGRPHVVLSSWLFHAQSTICFVD